MNFVAPWLYAASAAVLSALALAFAFGGVTPGVAHTSLAVGAATAAAGFWHARGETLRRPRLKGWEWGAVILFALFAQRAFLWLVFFDGDDIKVLSPNNLGDLALHLTYIREVANGVPFWPDNPIFAGTKLSYPIGVDLLHSLILLCGGDLYRTFIWMGLGGAALTGVMLYRWGGAFTMTGFLCNGGLVGFAALLTVNFDPASPLWHLEDYQSTFAWKSIPLALFVTQRGFLFALPAGLLLLCSWKARYFADPADPAPVRPLPRWGEWLLYASMPVFHFHTFLFLSVLLGVWFCFYEKARLDVLRLLALSVVPATLLVLLITEFFHGPKALGWAPGWMQDDPDYLKWCATHLLPHSDAMTDIGEPPIVGTSLVWITRPAFWVLNFGVLPFLIAALLAKVENQRSAARDRAFLWPAAGVFVLCCFVKFAPWEWDNTKLMIWSYLVALPFLWQRLIRPWPYSVRVIACVALFGSGFFCLLGGLHDGTGSSIAKRSELDPLERDLRGISVQARFIARPNYNHPLLLLGRKVAAGYIGHLWSHGYNWEATVAHVKIILDGGNGWRELAKGLGARYLFWGAQEMEEYPASTEPWKGTCRVVATGEWGTVYDLESAP
jgi:hypothetical protein